MRWVRPLGICGIVTAARDNNNSPVRTLKDRDVTFSMSPRSATRAGPRHQTPSAGPFPVPGRGHTRALAPTVQRGTGPRQGAPPCARPQRVGVVLHPAICETIELPCDCGCC